MTAPAAVQRGSRHALIYGVGIMLGKAVAFVMLPFYTRYLTPADYGIVQLVDMTLDVVSILAGTRIAQGVFRYYHKAESPDERSVVMSTALLLLGALFGTAAAATASGAGLVSRMVFGTDAHAALVRIAAGSLGLQALVVVPFAYLRLRERSALFTGLTTVKLALQVAMNILFLAGFGWGAKGVLLSNLLANAALGAFLVGLVVRQVGVRFSRPVARSLFRYGLPLVVTQMATFIATFGDRYFLRVHGDLAAVGVYSLAYQFGFILATVGFLPFQMMWEPMRFEVAKRPNPDAAVSAAFVHMNLLLLTAMVGLGLFVKDFIVVMADPAYHGAAALVPLILIAYVFQSWAGFQETGILVRERTEFITLANVLSALTAIAGYAVLIPRWLGLGAAIATVLAFAVRQVITHVVAQRLWPVRYHWRPVIRLIGAAALVWATGLLAPSLPLGWSLLLRVALMLLYVVAVWHLNILSTEDRDRIRRSWGAAQGAIGTVT